MLKIVQIYYNSHLGNYSVRDQKSRLVVAHLDSLGLKGCTFKVSEIGRQRVLRERRKNVHAWAEGTLTTQDMKPGKQIKYNPYHGPSFYEVDTGLPVKSAEFCLFLPEGVYLGSINESHIPLGM